MIDVVFLLLVYFMVATKFKLGEQVYQLDLPRSLQSNRDADPFELDEQPVVVEVASTGPVGSDYVLRVEGASPQPDSFDDLFDFFRDRQIGTGTRPMFMNDHPIIIRPGRAARWEHAIGAFNAAARAEYTNIKFAVPE
jgi:biopolymer transport protein ExbD